jgi:hypothetical protein
MTVILTELDRAKFDLESLVIGLVGLHGAHRTESRIAAPL